MQPVAEAIVGAETALGTGYSESKWVAEKILEASASRGLDARVIRVGQLSGAANGLWNTKEWFPALIQGGQAVGCLPDGDWV
jgi:thioester reductase-like protein